MTDEVSALRVDKDTFALYCRTDFTLYTWHTQGTTTLLHRSRRLPLRGQEAVFSCASKAATTSGGLRTCRGRRGEGRKRSTHGGASMGYGLVCICRRALTLARARSARLRRTAAPPRSLADE